MKKGEIGIGTIFILILINISAGIMTTKFIMMVWRAQDAAIIVNMHTFQTALEEMAVLCEGHYPLDAVTTVNDIRMDFGLPLLPNCANGGQGDKSIAGAASGYGIPAGECVFLPRSFANPVVPPPNLT